MTYASTTTLNLIRAASETPHPGVNEEAGQLAQEIAEELTGKRIRA